MSQAVSHSTTITPQSSSGGSHLLQLVKEQKWRYLHEKSFKLTRGHFLGNRFLLTIQKYDVGPRANSKLIDLCASIDMPRHFFETLKEEIAEADVLHIGYEQGENSDVYKLYLEYPSQFRRQVEHWQPGKAPVLVHRAYKWNPANISRHTITSYHGFPGLNDQQIAQRISNICQDFKDDVLFELAQQLLRLVGSYGKASDLFYMEVEEDNNPRRSFDLNLYDVGLRFFDINPMLNKLLLYFEIDLADYRHYLNAIDNQNLGHLAGGINRHGKTFCSLYYGVEESL